MLGVIVMTKKQTRAELITGLSQLQIDRLENMAREDESRHAKIYFYYHDKNAKLSTQKLKSRIAREVMWKAQSNRI